MIKKYKIAFDMIRSITFTSNMKTKRLFADFLADKIMQISTEKNIMTAMEQLKKVLNSEISKINREVFLEFIKNVNELNSVFVWIKKFPSIVAMIATLKKEEYEKAIKEIDIEENIIKDGVAAKLPKPEIPIKITCLSSFAHGGDVKAGNSTLFRRQNIICTNGLILSLPFYAGNAFRGTIRDILADYFINELGIKGKKNNDVFNLWFFHILYAGGALEELGTNLKKIMEKIGKSGAINTNGIYEFRNIFPQISMLGTAIGNRILSGRVNFCNFRPQCKEYGTGENVVSELFELTFLTRKEDFENYEEHSGMIANTECLKTGVVMEGGIETSKHIDELERSALGCGLKLLKKKGWLGAENRRGLGKVNIEIENMPCSKQFEEHVDKNKNKIIKYLKEVDAIATDNINI